jgi:hypothetical protein
MKITIKANNKITDAKITKYKDVARHPENVDGVYMIEFEFEKADIWSDLEFWMDDENGNYCDHITLNVTKKKKLQFHK